MRRLIKVCAGICALAAAVAVPSSAGGSNRFSDQTDRRDCGDGDAITFVGPTTLWPPNHKYRTVTITATSANSSEQVALETTAVSDEADLTPGSGHTINDADPSAAMDTGNGSASVQHRLRGERSGPGDGRTYTIDATATYGMMRKTCMQRFVVQVPHDMGRRGG